MKVKTILSNFALLALMATVLVLADPLGLIRGADKYPAGSISRAEGLQNWQTFYAAASHPRCVNCHADSRPMWSGPSYDATRPHDMNVQSGESRSGAETLPCSTCHAALPAQNPEANRLPHTAPRIAGAWPMAPREAAWLGRSSVEICEQLKDPARNGNRTIAEVAAHIGHALVLRWAWAPNGTREPTPHSVAETQDALLKWGAAGTPYPG